MDKTKKYIRCIGADRKLHTCEPHSNKTKCGLAILNKKPSKKDMIDKFSCYECTY